MTIRPPVKWHGGKRYLADRIIGLFPDHRIYLEPFGGAASVLLNKKPVEVENYNDLDLRITRLFRVLRDRRDEFLSRVRMIPYSQVEFESAVYDESADDLTKAVCDYVRWRQSFGGRGKSWSYTTSRARGGMAGDVNAWWSAIDDVLPAVMSRLERVQISCEPAIKIIPKFDHPDCLIYCDPPYVHSTRAAGSTDVYGVEMTDDDHRRLAKLLRECRSKVAVSGYLSPLYEELFSNWRRQEFDIANHAAGGKSKARQIECLWMNY